MFDGKSKSDLKKQAAVIYLAEKYLPPNILLSTEDSYSGIMTFILDQKCKVFVISTLIL